MRRLLDTIAARAFAAVGRAAPVPCRCGPHLNHIVETFLAGYRAAIELPDATGMATRLSVIEPVFQGFAFEGAAMALTALDALSPGPEDRFARLLARTPSQTYLLHVGAGWAYARVPWAARRSFVRLDPVLHWLALDGLGFHEGFFRRGRAAARDRRRRWLSPYGARVFDQGLGRSLWFTAGADPGRIAAAVAACPSARRADLWSGVGLACGYAGGVDDTAIRQLCEASGPARGHLAQGVAFAAEAYVRAIGDAPPHAERACRIVCDMSADHAAALARQAAVGLPADDATPAYESWRSRLRTQLEAAWCVPAAAPGWRAS